MNTISDGEKRIIRVGVLGAARIARKNVCAIANTSESGCILTAVASRSEGKAKKLVEDTGIKVENKITFLEGPQAYDDLISSTDLIDALYIPLPTSVCKAWVIKALESGKHVLVEKPVSLSINDYDSMLKAAYKSNKYLQDGTMFVHHPRTHFIINNDDLSKKLGSINRVNASFTFLGDDDFHNNDIRTSENGDPLGCIGDLGWYCVRFGLLVFQDSHVESAQVVQVEMNSAGVPIDATCLVSFDNGRLLSFHCSFRYPLNQRFQIIGSNELLTVDDLILPRKGDHVFSLENQYLTEFDKVTVHTKNVHTVESISVQEVLMWKHFSKVAANLDLSSMKSDRDDTQWTCACPNTSKECQRESKISYQTQKVIDGLIKSAKSNGEKIHL